MKILKIYQVHINISAEEVYRGLINDLFIIDKIKNLYEGKCLASTLIIRITRIVEKSGFYPSKSLTNGSSDIDIRFEAEALVYNKDDIIVDCEIRKIENTGQIVCTAEHATIRLEVNRIVQALGEGVLIPTKVHNSAYSLGKPEITVTGEIFQLPEKTAIVYNCIGVPKLSEDVLEQLKMLRAKLSEISAELDLVDKKTRAFFDNIFYPWKEVPKHKMTTTTLDELINYSDKNTTVVLHPYLSNTNCVVLGEVKMDQFKVTVVPEQFDVVLFTLFAQRLAYCTAILAYCKKYDTADKRDANKKAWNFYLRKQK